MTEALQAGPKAGPAAWRPCRVIRTAGAPAGRTPGAGSGARGPRVNVDPGKRDRAATSLPHVAATRRLRRRGVHARQGTRIAAFSANRSARRI